MEPQGLHEYKTDHDILLELRVEMRLLREDIREMKDETKVTIGDHENRIRIIEASISNVLVSKQTSDKITRVGGMILIFAVSIVEFIVSHFWR